MDTAVSRSPIRSLQVFEAFRLARQPLSLTEIARLAKLPISTCHGIVRTLEHHGFLYFVSERDAYPTRRLWDIASVIAAHDPVIEHLLPALSSLRDATGETIILGKQQEGRVLYLLVVESRQSIRYSSEAGQYKPLHSSAIGKCLLGAMPAAELREWLARNALSAVTDHTITDPQRLLDDLRAARERGGHVTRGENVSDVMGIAAPLRFGSLTLGIAVAGPLHRMEPAESRIIEQLRGCVQQLDSEQEVRNV